MADFSKSGLNADNTGVTYSPFKDKDGNYRPTLYQQSLIDAGKNARAAYMAQTAPTRGTGSVAPASGGQSYGSSGGGKSGGGGGFGSGGSGGGGLIGQIADAYSQPLDFSGLSGLSNVSAPSQQVDFTDAFDPRFQNVGFTDPFDSRLQGVNFMDPFDSRLQGVTFGGGTQGVDFSGGGPSVATLDWNEGGGGQGGAPPMQQAPMQQAAPTQGGGKGAGKGGMAAQPQPFGRLYG